MTPLPLGRPAALVAAGSPRSERAVGRPGRGGRYPPVRYGATTDDGVREAPLID
ncbi:hypothetical protein QNO09_23080 [Streptomyces sp. 378]|uniref:hypothetical protein n=1 Tax=Streptomyces sp. 378 TaxID=3049412 RepID=UPI0024C24C94|nr:hypothetical protein [Streptomyces sp. 378]MDK1346138.1 hypothetical protein [Streptomyces sp. 378]